jgi:hypothetical protein
MRRNAMAKKKEVQIPIPSGVIQRVKNEVKGDNVTVIKFNINDIPIEFMSLLHPDVKKKSTCAYLAVSGCPEDGLNYAFLGFERVDKNDIDLDPIVMAYDLETGSPAPSGVATYHGKFTERTVPISAQYGSMSVAQIVQAIKTEKMPFSKAPPKLTTAMGWVANKYRKHYPIPRAPRRHGSPR